ncbi:hypothetical protein Syun_011580 [Stephania yunnanensis]|uniref:Uncharacterized protein n=1 Tax=Stephania yunnanensis TaxID=152371 RepID=A0AAP0PI93_9MAGN
MVLRELHQGQSRKRARDNRDQLEGLLESVEIEPTSNPNDLEGIKTAITPGFFPHSARLRKSGAYTTVRNPQSVHIHPASGLAQVLPSWFHLTDLDGGPPFIFPVHLLTSQGSSGGNFFDPIGYLLEKSLYKSSNLYIPGSVALEGAFSCISNFTGALLFWCASHSSFSIHHELPGKSCHSRPGNVKQITRCEHKLPGLCFGPKSREESSGPGRFGKIENFTIAKISKEFEQCQMFPTLSLAAAFVSPFDNLNPKVLAVPLENTDVQVNGLIDQTPSVNLNQESLGLPFPEMNWTRQSVEPITGVKFPTVLHNRSTRNTNSTEVGFFRVNVHPGSICEKLGPKYSSVPVGELHDCPDFFDDLLREDISMTVRLVVNCNGLNIKTCIREISSGAIVEGKVLKRPDVAQGTTIDFQQTADGELTTERAFFDMYIGDNPVSVQTKEEIARKVGSIMSRC